MHRRTRVALRILLACAACAAAPFVHPAGAQAQGVTDVDVDFVRFHEGAHWLRARITDANGVTVPGVSDVVVEHDGNAIARTTITPWVENVGGMNVTVLIDAPLAAEGRLDFLSAPAYVSVDRVR